MDRIAPTETQLREIGRSMASLIQWSLVIHTPLDKKEISLILEEMKDKLTYTNKGG